MYRQAYAYGYLSFSLTSVVSVLSLSLLSGGSKGGKSGHAPPSKLAMEFSPPRGQKE